MCHGDCFYPAGTAIDGGGTTLHATHQNHPFRPVFMRGEAYASLKNALEVLLSRTSLDLGSRVSQHTSKHPIDTQKLSPLLRIPLCSMSPDFLNLLKRGHENAS